MQYIDEKKEIIKSTDYQLLKIIDGNREIKSHHINALARAIQKDNLLHIEPILVNEKMEILDGQHRYKAAELIRVPYYYRIVNDAENSSIGILNTNRKNWTLVEFASFYSKVNNNKHYIKLENLLEKQNWKIGVAFAFLGYNIRTREAKDRFCSGAFEYDFDEELLETRIQHHNRFFMFCKDKDIIGYESFSTLSCINAFFDFTESKRIDWNTFCDRLNNHYILIGRRHNRDEFIEMFLLLYNKGNTYRIEKCDL